MKPARFRMPALAVTITAAAVTPLLILAAPAQAASAAHGGSGPIGAQASTRSVNNSPYFAGYEATVATGSATSSAAQFTVPKLSCTSAYRAITPVAGVTVNSTSYSSAFVFTGCYKGKAVYFPALVVNGSETNYTSTPVHAGDVIKVSAKVTTGTTVSVTDVTTGVTKKLTGPAGSSSVAYVGDSYWELSSGTLLGVPKFGTLAFTGCSIDGKAIARAHPLAYQRVNSSGVVQIATGALSSKGTAFATRYKHS